MRAECYTGLCGLRELVVPSDRPLCAPETKLGSECVNTVYVSEGLLCGDGHRKRQAVFRMIRQIGQAVWILRGAGFRVLNLNGHRPESGLLECH